MRRRAFHCLIAVPFFLAVSSSTAAQATPCASHVNGLTFPTIQLALTAADATGSPATIDGGTCDLPSGQGLTVPGGVEVSGNADGAGATIIKPHDSVPVVMLVSQSTLRPTTYGFNIHDLTIDGSADTFNQGAGLRVNGGNVTAGQAATVYNMLVYSLHGSAILIGSPDTTITPLVASSSAPATIHDNYIYNLSNLTPGAGGLGPDGIGVVGSYINVTGNTVANLHSYGSNGVTAFTNSNHVTISNNNIANTTDGVGMDNSNGTLTAQYNTISGNTIHNVCGGVSLYRQTNDYVQNNVIYNDQSGTESDGTPLPRDNVTCTYGLFAANVPNGIGLGQSALNYVTGNYVNMGGNTKLTDGIGIAQGSTGATGGAAEVYNSIGQTGAGNAVYNGIINVDDIVSTGGTIAYNAYTANTFYYSPYGCAYSAGDAPYHSGNSSTSSNCLP